MATEIRTDPDEQRTVRAFLAAARVLTDQLGQELRRENGMLQIQYELLARLSESEHRRLKMTDLARNAGVSVSRLSHLADRLEQRGWIRRIDSPADGRVHLAELTDIGERALVEAVTWPRHSRLRDVLTQGEMDQLRHLSDRLRSALDGAAEKTPP